MPRYPERQGGIPAVLTVLGDVGATSA